MATEIEKPEAETMCDEHIDGFRAKADHNKTEALATFILVVTTTLVTPLFVMLGEGFWFGKLVPSILSLLAAFATAWLQLRKPQQLWLLYRSCQRSLEDHRTKYKFRLDGYASTKDPEKKLAKAVAEVAMYAHMKWEGLVPSPEQLKLREPTASPMLGPAEAAGHSLEAEKGTRRDSEN